MSVLLSALYVAVMLSTARGDCSFNPLCTCRRSHHEVICRGVPFAEFPALPLKEAIYQVTIIRSGLEVLHHHFLNGSSIASLHMMQNSLFHISPNAFSGLEAILTTLDLSHNQLGDTAMMALLPLKNLQWLNLKGNSLESLHQWPKMGFKEVLTSLYLGSNQLTRIPEDAFSGFVNLDLLDIEENLIHDIDNHPFPKSLQVLSLSNNILKKVPLHAIYMLRNLRSLFLSGNLFRKLPCPFHLHVSRLEKLEISNNMLTDLPECVFNGSFTIKELHLDFNFIRVLYPRCFKGTELERLVLSNNRISTIYSDAFVGVERTLKTLDMSFNLIEEFPLAVNNLKSLLYLSLKSNLLHTLEETDLQGFSRTLEMLDLSGNMLEEIPSTALKHMKKLVRLSLQDNKIRKIHSDDFKGWGETLTTLSLANNGITDLAESSFVHLRKLKELKLSFNNIISVSHTIFETLQKTLEVLDLSSAFATRHCPIDVLLKNLRNLEWMQMDHNNISKLSVSNLSSKIRHLDLNNNNIKEIPYEFFTNSRHLYLSVIKLGNNELTIIKSNTFWDIQHVSSIVLFGNRISIVEDYAFAHCSYLHTIVLSKNSLTTIAPSAFHNLTKLSNLFLQDNFLEEFSLDVIEFETSQLYINLSNNALKELNGRRNNSDTLTKVKTLDATKNQISVISHHFMTSISTYLVYLFLSKNYIVNISFPLMPMLQVLDMSCNKVFVVNSKDFECCPNVQILSLNHNNISTIMNGAFNSLPNLRVLDLSYNSISSLSPNLFTRTKLEKFNITGNNLIAVAFNLVHRTLRTLDLSLNQLYNLSSMNLTGLSKLQALNLSSNHISNLDDDGFSGLEHLLELDLSNNPLQKVLNESFTNVPSSLRTLKLCNSSLRNIASLPFPRLHTLSLRNNYLQNISQEVLQNCEEIRHFDVSGNILNDVPTHLWPKTRHLTTLDISYNPIEVLGANSFAGLDKLQVLDISGLALKRLEPRTLHGLRFLQSLHTHSYPSVRSFRLQDLLSSSQGLLKVTLLVEETTLSHQLQGAFTPKLRELVVTGSNLVRILPDAFLGLSTHRLILRISGTGVERLPDGLLRYLPDIRHLTLDLRNNRLQGMGPRVLEMATRGGAVGGQTQHISGGVLLEDNPWRCSCELLWLGRWLRRWLRETFHVHMLGVEAALYVGAASRRATCLMTAATHHNNRTSREIAIIDLKASEVDCDDVSKRSGAALVGGLFAGYLVAAVCLLRMVLL